MINTEPNANMQVLLNLNESRHEAFKRATEENEEMVKELDSALREKLGIESHPKNGLLSLLSIVDKKTKERIILSELRKNEFGEFCVESAIEIALKMPHGFTMKRQLVIQTKFDDYDYVYAGVSEVALERYMITNATAREIADSVYKGFIEMLQYK